MLDNIVAHCRQVCRISLLLAGHWSFSDQRRELIRAAALLHDITKTRSFKTGENHAESGARLLAELGFPEVAGIVGQHVRLNRYPSGDSAPTEAEIVNYADKRVLHDRIVPLDERMGYILERYGFDEEHRQNILCLWDRTRRLERRLFAGLPMTPDDLSRLAPGSSSGC